MSEGRRSLATVVVLLCSLAAPASAQVAASAVVAPPLPAPKLALPKIALPAGMVAPPPGRGPSFPISMAQVTTAPPAPVVPNCPEPSLATCQSAGYLTSYCGAVTRRASCRTLIERAMRTEFDALPPQPGQRSVVGVRAVRGLPPDYSDFVVSGLSHLAAGDQQKQSLSLQSFLWAIVVTGFEQNGNNVIHCQEYVREKFYGLAQLQDATLGAKDARAYFDLAVQKLPNMVLRSRDRGLAFTIPWPRNLPKNRYGTVVSNWYPPDISPGIRPVSRDNTPWTWQAAVSGLVAVKDFAWHRARATALAGYSDDDLTMYHHRQKRFVALVQQREALKLEYDDALRRLPPPALGTSAVDAAARHRPFRDGYARKFLALDELIMWALVEAKVDGCLEPGLTACDWSPDYFHEEFEAMVANLKQPALKECQTLIGAAFADSDAVARSRLAACAGDCRAGTTKLDAYLADLRGEAARLKPKGGANPKVGQEAGDDSYLGKPRFNAGFDYSSGWSANGFILPTSRACDANFSLHGDFSAYVTVLGHRADVAALHGEITSYTDATRARASMRVLGQDLFTPVDHRAATSYHIVEGPSWDADFGPPPLVIVIIAIPVKLRAGLAGSTGAQFGLGAGAVSRSCTGPNPVALLNADAIVRPFASLDAFASASIDLAVAEAGVRGELSLLSASLPFRLNLALTQDSRSIPQLSVNTRMALDLSTLNGRIFLFAEAFGEEARKEIIKWRGVHTNVPLFETPAITLPLSVLRSE